MHISIFRVLLSLIIISHSQARHLGAKSTTNRNLSPVGTLAKPYLASLNYSSFAAPQTITYPVTPTISGLYWIAFAFRHDPEYWHFSYPSLIDRTTPTIQILRNADFASGSVSSYKSALGVVTPVKLPSEWAVFYEGQTIPVAAGTWEPHMWTDGAVGIFDGIFQCVVLTGGQTYDLSFNIQSPRSSDNDQIQLGIYASKTDLNNICSGPPSLGFYELITSPAATPSSIPSSTSISTITSFATPTEVPTLAPSPEPSKQPPPCIAPAAALSGDQINAVVATQTAMVTLLAIAGLGALVGIIISLLFRFVWTKTHLKKIAPIIMPDGSTTRDSSNDELLERLKILETERDALSGRLTIADKERNSAASEFLGLRADVNTANKIKLEALAEAEKLRIDLAATIAAAEKARLNAASDMERLHNEAAARVAESTAAADKALAEHSQESEARAVALTAALALAQSEASAARAAAHSEQSELDKALEALSAAKTATDALRIDADKALAAALDNAHNDMEKALAAAKAEATRQIDAERVAKEKLLNERHESDTIYENRIAAAAAVSKKALTDVESMRIETDRLRALVAKQGGDIDVLTTRTIAQDVEIAHLKALLMKAATDAKEVAECE
jgi:hypothetical protein